MKIVINLKSEKNVSTRTNLETKKSFWLSLLHGTLLWAWHWAENMLSYYRGVGLAGQHFSFVSGKHIRLRRSNFVVKLKREIINSLSHRQRPLETVSIPGYRKWTEQECLCLHVGIITKVKFFCILFAFSFLQWPNTLEDGASVTHSRLIYKHI